MTDALENPVDTGEMHPLLSMPSKAKQRNMTMLPLLAILFLIVAGGSGGTDNLNPERGSAARITRLLVVGMLWSVPMVFMSTEMTIALP